MYATFEYGDLPMVKYLLKRGADMEAKEKVRDILFLFKNHTHATHAYI